MTATKMAGVPVAKQIKAQLKERVLRLSASGVVPGLATVLVGDDPGSQSYVAGKHRDCAEVGIQSIRVDMPADTSAKDLAAQLDQLNRDPACTGYIVQLPLPKHLDDNWALSLVDPEKDADGLHPVNLGRLVLGIPGALPCTPRGIVALLRYYDVEINGAHTVIIGRGTTVGRPLGLLLTRKSENSTVTLCHTGTRDLASLTAQADIVVTAAGTPGMLTADMIREGSVLVDVGITRTGDGLVGDLNPDVWEKASLIAPIPGGVGPMTRAMLLSNVVDRAEAQHGMETQPVATPSGKDLLRGETGLHGGQA